MGGCDLVVRMIICLCICRRWELMGNYGIMCKSGYFVMVWLSMGFVFKRVDFLLIVVRNCIWCLVVFMRLGMIFRMMVWVFFYFLERVL